LRDLARLRSFRLEDPADATCWLARDGWRLSTYDPRAPLN